MPESAGPGTANPLLHADGTSRIGPSTPDGVRYRHEPTAFTRADGPRVQVRANHERGARTYEITIDPATPAECAAVIEAVKVTRNGARATRWRHPEDDAPGTSGNIDQAPRFRMLQDSVRIDRASPSRVKVGLSLEEV